MNTIEFDRIISEYELLVQSIDKIIERSPFKLSYILNKMDMNRTTFYNKRKQASFSTTELKRLFSILSDSPSAQKEKKIITNLLQESKAQYEKGEFRPFKDIIAESLKRYES